jgi:hypothetical protein
MIHIEVSRAPKETFSFILKAKVVKKSFILHVRHLCFEIKWFGVTNQLGAQ